MKRETKITSAGIRKVLKNYNHNNSIAEYIWNGFDTKATTVKLDYEADALGRIHSISISDNGYGINTAKLDEKFDKFYDSEKSIEIQSPKHSSTLHGKNGIGRLTFFTFANNAEWKTCYKNGKFRGGLINIDSNNLKSSTAIETEPPFQETGTVVTFKNITIFEQNIEKEIIPFLKEEFCWFLELHKNKNYSILINNSKLDYSDLILDTETFIVKEQSVVFDINYIQWSKILNKENSKFYYLNKKGDEVYKDFTTLNRKGDQFYHSLYIQSRFFNDFNFKNQNEAQVLLFAKAKSAPEYKKLNKELDNFLQKKRKPFLRHYAETLIDDYERLGVFPIFTNTWELARKAELKETIMGLYEVQPKIFVDLNIEQKKTFVRFLNLLLDSNEREHIFDILDEVTKLDPTERKDLANLFRTTKLNRIVSTLKMIEDRYKTYHDLYDIVFKQELNAAEVPHLQTIIENHYWLFGEEYHLVTAAEPKFNEALKRYLFHLNGENSSINIEHQHKNREMDIFACRQNIKSNKIENIVVELKHPTIGLGEKEYSQVIKYMSVISSRPEFNAPNMEWKFYLIGNKFDTSDFIDNQIETNRMHGETSLVMSKDKGRIKFYVKTWKEVLNEFELKHNFLNAKLKLERDKLIANGDSADEIVKRVIQNSAVSPPEVDIKQ